MFPKLKIKINSFKEMADIKRFGNVDGIKRFEDMSDT